MRKLEGNHIMRILILSCNTGEGHNSAAKALRECFEQQQIDCDIQDALAFWSPNKSKIISHGHVFIYRKLPRLFGVSYRFEENHMKEGGEGFIYDLVTKGCHALYQYLLAQHYDIIICTHVFSSMMITELKKHTSLSVKSYFISTDYTCSPGVNQTNLDYYVIPHSKLAEEFIQNGIPADKLITAGIPVKGAFFTKTEPTAAKKSLSLPLNKKVVLLMCGSMGCGPIKELSELLPQKLPPDAVLVIICGNNRRLYKSLTKNPLPENVRVIGYTTRMPLYMDAAELILTKPGGLSSTEAAAKALPMVFIDAVPGCETRNLEFFTKNGFADASSDPDVLTDTVCCYLHDSKKSMAQSYLLQKNFSEPATVAVYQHIMNHALCYSGT